MQWARADTKPDYSSANRPELGEFSTEQNYKRLGIKTQVALLVVMPCCGYGSFLQYKTSHVPKRNV
uniref:Uncharacterized protein n=1 Tax=Monopterus albus TaxID=43700 RepID=A0A3Q3J6J2_MONAL